jgi:hypothetical protein
VATGCLLQAIAAKPGDTYVIEGKCRQAGAGQAWLHVSWQSPEGKWHAQAQDRVVPIEPVAGAAPGVSGAGAWTDVRTIVQAPEGTGKVVILLGVDGQASAEDSVWFDDMHVYRVE